jgi:hypothetical protein
VAQEGGFVYDADSYADDVPYWRGKQLIVPYTLDANDMKFVALNGFTEGQQFFHYLRDTFDQLHAEGGRMMSIGLHGRIAGSLPAPARWLVSSTISPAIPMCGWRAASTSPATGWRYAPHETRRPHLAGRNAGRLCRIRARTDGG